MTALRVMALLQSTQTASMGFVATVMPIMFDRWEKKLPMNVMKTKRKFNNEKNPQLKMKGLFAFSILTELMETPDEVDNEQRLKDLKNILE